MSRQFQWLCEVRSFHGLMSYPLLDCPDQSCKGQLNFTRLIEARLPPNAPHTMANDNPFNHPVSRQIISIISKDIKERSKARDVFDDRLNERFLIDPNSRVELVGIPVHQGHRAQSRGPAKLRGDKRHLM
jgi:hypothetical protein